MNVRLLLYRGFLIVCGAMACWLYVLPQFHALVDAGTPLAQHVQCMMQRQWMTSTSGYIKSLNIWALVSLVHFLAAEEPEFRRNQRALRACGSICSICGLLCLLGMMLLGGVYCSFFGPEPGQTTVRAIALIVGPTGLFVAIVDFTAALASRRGGSE